ncbi:unnamed protein product [Bemisia tabaci]|uniref:Uncharacterized protein n=1 Tax=Bemisia tabaci TaxID=7038 RepID=A0A9P0F3I7_BEMTA|nr:unnamed protein product [Bemisia tabaci]
MRIGFIFLLLLHAAPFILGQRSGNIKSSYNDTLPLDEEPPGDNDAPPTFPSTPTSNDAYDDFGPSAPPASSPEPPLPPSLAPPTTPVTEATSPSTSPLQESEPEAEPELEQPAEPFPLGPPDTSKIEYSDVDYEDAKSSSTTKSAPLPRFTKRTTTITTSTRAPAIIETEQDYLPPPASSGSLKIPKFDVPRGSNERFKANGGGPPPFRRFEPGGSNEREIRPWDRESGYTGNRSPFGRARASADGPIGYLRDPVDSGYQVAEERLADDGKADGKATTQQMMLGIALASVFAAMLVIFILTFLLMDRIVALA